MTPNGGVVPTASPPIESTDGTMEHSRSTPGSCRSSRTSPPPTDRARKPVETRFASSVFSPTSHDSSKKPSASFFFFFSSVRSAGWHFFYARIASKKKVSSSAPVRVRSRRASAGESGYEHSAARPLLPRVLHFTGGTTARCSLPTVPRFLRRSYTLDVTQTPRCPTVRFTRHRNCFLPSVG